MRNRKVSALIFISLMIVIGFVGVFPYMIDMKEDLSLDIVEDKENNNDDIEYPTDWMLGENVV